MPSCRLWSLYVCGCGCGCGCGCSCLQITVIEASLDAVNEELREYEPIIAKIQAKGKRSGQRFWMITLAAMSAQFGFLAELTFNQFSWDLVG